MWPNRDTLLEINLGALAHNYNFLRSRLAPDTLLLAVVKAYAYGSDAVAVAKKLEELGANYLAVAFTDEGIQLRKGGVRLPIMVFHPQESGLEALVQYNLEPSLYSRKIFNSFTDTLSRLGKNDFPIHLKFNTGLNRLGFGFGDTSWLANTTKETNCVRVASVYSHLAASDDPAEQEFTQNQIASFRKILEACTPWLPPQALKHLLNTSGILNYPEAQFNMVRTGIGLHGYSNNPKTDQLLKPLACLKTKISQLNRIAPGDWVGYNKGFVSKKEMVVATLPLGHADGIARQFGHGHGHFIVNGKPAPTLGNICMDMTMVDVTEIDCTAGDEVHFFGCGYSAEVQAANAGTISYELLSGISQRITRHILPE